MKLYSSAGTCSLSPHIVLRETNTPFSLVKTDIRNKTTAEGDFRAKNPNGYVPALELDDGTLLTEGAAIVQYIADHAGATGLAPANGTLARYQMQSWLNFVSSEVHKTFSPLFNARMPEEAKALFKEKLSERFKFLDDHLSRNDYLMGKNFTLPDAYLFTVARWAAPLKIDLASMKHLSRYMERIAARPSVEAALKAEAA